MKKIVIIFILVFTTAINAQENSPKDIVTNFFSALHAKDTTAINKLCHSKIVMRTIVLKKEVNELQEENLATFLKAISSIPSNVKIEEKLLDYKIEIDGNLAHVWTPYEFYVNDTLSHVGANAFTLYDDNGKWLIIHLIDTRRRK